MQGNVWDYVIALQHPAKAAVVVAAVEMVTFQRVRKNNRVGP